MFKYWWMFWGLIGGALSLGTINAAESGYNSANVKSVLPDIDAYIEKTMTEWKIPGVAIGIVVGDKLVYAKGYGVKELGSQDPVDADTVFQIGSTTKAFLATTEAMLIDDNKLGWNDRVIDYDSNFRLYDPWVTREFRIVDLLAQRSGLPGWALTNMILYGYSHDDVINTLRYVQPITSFRANFAYQNAFHLVLGRILARLEGKNIWGEVLQERIFNPLQMNSSSYTAQAMANSSNHSSGHRLEGGNTAISPLAIFPYNAGGSGNINSTVHDMSKWLRFQINGGVFEGKRLISAAALRQTYLPRILIEGALADMVSFSPEDVMSYALGWIIHSLPYGRIIEHAGATMGFNAYVAFDPDRQFGVVVLTNAVEPEHDRGIAIPVGKYIVDRLLARPKVDYAAQLLQKSSPTPDKPSAGTEKPLALKQYTGKYHSPALGTINIDMNQNGELNFVLGPHKLPVILKPWAGNIFIAKVIYPAYGTTQGSSGYDTAYLHFRMNTHGDIERFDWESPTAPGFPPFDRVK